MFPRETQSNFNTVFVDVMRQIQIIVCQLNFIRVPACYDIDHSVGLISVNFIYVAVVRASGAENILAVITNIKIEEYLRFRKHTALEPMILISFFSFFNKNKRLTISLYTTIYALSIVRRSKIEVLTVNKKLKTAILLT